MLDYTLFGNTVAAWLIALGVLVGASSAVLVARRFVGRKLEVLSKRTETPLDDLLVVFVRGISMVAVVLIAAYLGALALTLPPSATKVLRGAFIIALFFQAGVWAAAGVALFGQRAVAARAEDDRSAATTLTVLTFLGRLAVWGAVVRLALDNLGFDITTVVAGIGEPRSRSDRAPRRSRFVFRGARAQNLRL